MALRQIITNLFGPRYGLDRYGTPVWNRSDGSQLAIDVDASTGVPSFFTRTANGAEGEFPGEIPAGALTAGQVAGITGLTANQLTALATSLPIFEGTWAALLSGYPAASYSGKRALVVDPTYFTNTLRVRSDGTRWRLDGLQDLFVNLTPLTGSGGTVTTEQLQRQWTAPAGFLMCVRTLNFGLLYYKGATSDTLTARLRVGSGSTPLTDTATLSNALFSATTNRSCSVFVYLAPTSTTQIRALAAQNFLGGGAAGVSGAAYPTNTTIPDSDAAATVFSSTFQLTTGTDSSTSGVAHFTVVGS